MVSLIFVIGSVGLTLVLTPGWAQTCEQSLAQQVAVAGINPAWVSTHPLSNSVIPSMGFATADMASAIDATVGNFMNMNGLPGGAVAQTYKDQLIFAKSYGYVDVDNALF